MTKRFYIKNKLDFIKIFSTAHAVISLTENIEKATDDKVFVCGVSVDLQKALDTVDQKFITSNCIWYCRSLLHKRSHYSIRDIAKCWFSSFLSNRKQFVTINGFDSETQSFPYGILQGCVLKNAIKFSQSFHFADDTCLLNTQIQFLKMIEV